MNGPGHLLVGAGWIAGATWGVHIFSPDPLWQWGIVLGAGMVGALAPDIDHNQSTIRRSTGTQRGAGPLGCLGWIGGIFAAMLGGHRGFTHTGLCLALVVGLAWYIPTHIFFPALATPLLHAFGIGWASHLAADLITENGIPLLWPISSKRIHL